MSQEETVNPEYLKRFNAGYLIAKFMPELANQLLPDIEKINDAGLKEGIQQYKDEKPKDMRPAWLKEGRTSTLDDHSKDKEVDKDLDRD